MTQADRDRLVALKKAAKGLITRKQAAGELNISERQVYRLLAAMKERKDKAVVHGLRGRPSNRRLDPAMESKAIELLRDRKLRDYGPRLASQHLAKKHGIVVSKETMRQWMVRAGLWRSRKQRVHEVHVWRPRRERFGELVQWDTSEHDWLEGRGEVRYLITMIDDATSRVFARFVNSDSTEANMGVLEEYLRRFGRPLEFYTDKASIFHTTPKKNHPQRDTPLPATQIGRALQELGIGWIAAHSPQAKGRVERSFKTAQDRLVKLMRAEGVTTLEAANRYLDEFYLPECQALFSVAPACSDDAHRPLGPGHDLAAILCRVEHRVVLNNYTIQVDRQFWQIERDQVRPRLRGATVRVERRFDGSIAVRFEGKYLKVRLCEEAAPQLEIKPSTPPKPKDLSRGKPNRNWMQDFFRRPGRSIDQAIRVANETS